MAEDGHHKHFGNIFQSASTASCKTWTVTELSIFLIINKFPFSIPASLHKFKLEGFDADFISWYKRQRRTILNSKIFIILDLTPGCSVISLLCSTVVPLSLILIIYHWPRQFYTMFTAHRTMPITLGVNALLPLCRRKVWNQLLSPSGLTWLKALLLPLIYLPAFGVNTSWASYSMGGSSKLHPSKTPHKRQTVNTGGLFCCYWDRRV